MDAITDPNLVNFYFGVLSQMIAHRNSVEGFKTSTSKVRHDVDCGEFMLMCGNDKGQKNTELQFKHRDTRNYVYLRRDMDSVASPWKLIVPVTNKPFNKGYFDKFEIPAGIGEVARQLGHE